MVGQTVDSVAISAIFFLLIPTGVLPLFEQLALRDHHDITLLQHNDWRLCALLHRFVVELVDGLQPCFRVGPAKLDPLLSLQDRSRIPREAEPAVRGLDLAHPELMLLKNLDYAIVRKDRMAYVYDFG